MLGGVRRTSDASELRQRSLELSAAVDVPRAGGRRGDRLGQVLFRLEIGQLARDEHAGGRGRD